MFPIFLAILAATATIGGAVWQAWEKKKASEKADLNQKKADENQKKADLYFEKLMLANEEIKKLNTEVNSKAEKIIESNNALISSQTETLKKVMGAGYAKIIVGGVDENNLKCYIESLSNYPMYEVEITVCNYNEIIKCNQKADGKGNIIINRKCFNSNSLTFENTFTLNSQKTRPLGYTFKKDKTHFVLFKIATKHSTTFQYSIIEFERKQNLVYHAYKIFEVDMNGATKLLEDNSAEYPEELWTKNFHYRKQVFLEGYE